MVSEATQSYLEYMHCLGWQLNDSVQKNLDHICTETDWENPTTGQDWNNTGVVALIQAQGYDDLSMKASLIELAQEAFSEGEANYPLCKAHSALLKVLTGRFGEARQLAFSELLQLQMKLEDDAVDVPLGLIFFPLGWYCRTIDQAQGMELLYGSYQNGITQAYQYLNQVFLRSTQFFYNPMELPTLSLTALISPTLPIAQLKHGITCRLAQQFEGFIHLHAALRLYPTNATILQSLSLAYRDIGQKAIARHYWTQAIHHSQRHSDLAGLWTQAEPDATFTYVPFDKGVTLAVQPSLNSIVTSVLLGEGDWFESEMEFWRSWLKLGMTVIDVGANAGVYTFSAATRVGSEGKVISVEPFPACVEYLRETCRVNQFNWVKVYGAAASDQNGTVYLSVQGFSELNEVDTGNRETLPAGQYVDVPCLTLDSLIEEEKLQSVHILKLDAEGHEINVLRGCDRILSEFAPIILYENIAGDGGSNYEVANFLQCKGYHLHSYQPFIQKLIPLSSNEELDGNLNIIAVPSTVST